MSAYRSQQESSRSLCWNAGRRRCHIKNGLFIYFFFLVRFTVDPSFKKGNFRPQCTYAISDLNSSSLVKNYLKHKVRPFFSMDLIADTRDKAREGERRDGAPPNSSATTM